MRVFLTPRGTFVLQAAGKITIAVLIVLLFLLKGRNIRSCISAYSRANHDEHRASAMSAPSQPSQPHAKPPPRPSLPQLTRPPTLQAKLESQPQLQQQVPLPTKAIPTSAAPTPKQVLSVVAPVRKSSDSIASHSHPSKIVVRTIGLDRQSITPRG